MTISSFQDHKEMSYYMPQVKIHYTILAVFLQKNIKFKSDQALKSNTSLGKYSDGEIC